MKKRYRIDVIMSRIEYFTFCCIHPHNPNYVIVIDMFEKPIRMSQSDWDKITIESYEEAKAELIKHFKEMIESYKDCLSQM